MCTCFIFIRPENKHTFPCYHDIGTAQLDQYIGDGWTILTTMWHIETSLYSTWSHYLCTDIHSGYHIRIGMYNTNQCTSIVHQCVHPVNVGIRVNNPNLSLALAAWADHFSQLAP